MNHLSTQTSPYLLQHKNNPVHWFAWSDDAWQKAKAENKLVLISIGYSSCHWCHVMEHEVFEDDECAGFMNAHFICIKVDREERPDVDAIYMDTVHLMGGRGGWPLNVFALPDGRPVYGGTYFPKIQWLSILENLVELYRNQPMKMNEYAQQLSEGLSGLNIIAPNQDELPFDKEFLEKVVEHWSQYWDREKGGARKAPKFPMPNNWEFLLHVEHCGLNAQARKPDETTHKLPVSAFVAQTLTNMALGGIYDQVGGGFARYSVDDVWKVPHFEKMLYDNAQLVSLYAQAYRATKNTLFKEVIEQTLNWAEREMLSDEGLFYSALDADSEGVEGKFFVWTEDELRNLLGDDFEFAKKYFAVGQEGFWEHHQNILLRTKTDEEFARQENLSLDEVKSKSLIIRQKLLAEREKRIRPGLDDKCLTSWNALMVTAYVEAYKATGNEKYLQRAEHTATQILKLLQGTDGSFSRTRTKGTSHINGFLDDYAVSAEAFIHLYEVSMNESWLIEAKRTTDFVIANFFDAESVLFWYTSSKSEKLITRKKEIQDNVIPASNSSMCKVLFKLARHFENVEYEKMSEQMLRNILPQIDFASSYSNWLQAYACNAFPFFEMVITGPGAMEVLKELNSLFLPNTILCASTGQGELPLFRNRVGTKTAIYVCRDKTCYPPVGNIKEALQLYQQ